MLGFVLLSFKEGDKNDVEMQLRKEKEVKEICQTFGPYDAIVTLKCQNNEELRSIIYYKIRKMSNIESTLTLVSSSRDKRTST